MLILHFSLCQFPCQPPCPIPAVIAHLQWSLGCTGSWAQLTMAKTGLLWQQEEAAPCCPLVAQRPCRVLLPVHNHCPCLAAGTRRDASHWEVPRGRDVPRPCCALQCWDTAHSPAEKQHHRHEERLCWTCFRRFSLTNPGCLLKPSITCL